MVLCRTPVSSMPCQTHFYTKQLAARLNYKIVTTPGLNAQMTIYVLRPMISVSVILVNCRFSTHLACSFEQNQHIFLPAIQDRDSDDLRQFSNSTNPFPPTYYVSFLHSHSVLDAIGATSAYDACSSDVQAGFNSTGEVDKFLRNLFDFLIVLSLAGLLYHL